MAFMAIVYDVEYGPGAFKTTSATGNARAIFNWAIDTFRENPEKSFGPKARQIVCIVDYSINESDAEPLVQSVKLRIIVPDDADRATNFAAAIERFEQHMVKAAELTIDTSLPPVFDWIITPPPAPLNTDPEFPRFGGGWR